MEFGALKTLNVIVRSDRKELEKAVNFVFLWKLLPVRRRAVDISRHVPAAHPGRLSFYNQLA